MPKQSRKKYREIKGGEISQFFNEVGVSLKNLISRSREKGSNLINKGSNVLSNVVKGTSNIAEKTASDINKNITNLKSSEPLVKTEQKPIFTSGRLEPPLAKLSGGRRCKTHKKGGRRCKTHKKGGRSCKLHKKGVKNN